MDFIKTNFNKSFFFVAPIFFISNVINCEQVKLMYFYENILSTTYLNLSLKNPLFSQKREKLDAKIWFNFSYDSDIIFHFV